MYRLKPGTKRDLHRQWRLSDRIFFGFGACHVLAQSFLDRFPAAGFRALWIRPAPGWSGHHVVVTNGVTSYDYHGYSRHTTLLAHYFRQHRLAHPGWSAQLVAVHGSLFDDALRARLGMNMRGPTQYLHDARPRARRFLERHRAGHAVHVPGYSTAR